MENNNYQPQQQYQPQYQAPYQPQPQYQTPVQPVDPTTAVMSVGEYIGMFILSAIPFVNVICWIVWLVSAKTNRNKKNFIIAQIVLWVIVVVLTVVAAVVMAVTGVGAASMLDSF